MKAASPPPTPVFPIVVLLTLLVGLLFWRTFLGEVPVPTGSIFGWPPWKMHVPADFHGVKNDLLGDVTFQFVPWHLLVWERLRALHLPLWNQWNTGGMPLLANDQSGPFAPLSLLGVLLPPVQGLALTVPLKLVVAGTGMALYLRRAGCGLSGVWLGSVSFMLSGFMIVWLGWPHAQVAMLLPWLFWATHGVFADRGGAWVAALAACTAAGLLGGHAETSAHEMYAVGFYAVLLGLQHRGADGGRRNRFPQFVLGVTIGIAISGIQVVPLLEYLARSSVVELRRSQPPQGPLPSWASLAWITPQFVGHPGRGTYIYDLGLNFNEQCGYVGLTALVASGAAFWQGNRRRDALPLAALGVIAAVLVYGGPFRDLLLQLPGLRLAANQRLLLVIAFVMSSLGGLGLTAILEERRAAVISTVLAFVLAVATAVGGILFHRSFGRWSHGAGKIAGLSHGRYQLALWLPVAALVALCAVLALSQRSMRHSRAAVMLLVALAPCDLLAFAWHYNPTLPTRHVFPPLTETGVLREKAGDRWTVSFGWRLIPNANLPYRIRDLRSYDAVLDSRWWHYFSAIGRHEASFGQYLIITPTANVAPLEIAGVRFIGTGPGSEPSPPFRKVWSDDDSAIWEDPDARPLAYYADAIRLASRQEAEEALARGTGLQKNLAVLVEEPVVAEAGREPVPPHLERISPEHIRLEVEVQRPRLLVVNESYDPGWVASIDGVAAKLVPTNLVFQSVVVPAGRHRVELRYRPISVLIGAILSALGLVALAATVVVARRKRPVAVHCASVS